MGKAKEIEFFVSVTKRKSKSFSAQNQKGGRKNEFL